MVAKCWMRSEELFGFGVVLVGGGAVGDEAFDVGGRGTSSLMEARSGGGGQVLRSCGLLLGHAVERAEAPDEVGAVDAGDGAVGEAVGEGVEGDAVVGVVEGGDEDEVVGDVEVGVAGGEALAFEDDGCGHGEGADFEGLAVEVAGGAEAVEIFGEREVVLVGGVGLDGGEDGVFGDEAGDVVDVAVGVVAGAAAVEPEVLLDAEVVVEGLFELRAARRRGCAAGLRRAGTLRW